MEKLIFFVDPSWRKPGLQHTPLLYPFWGNAHDAARTPFQHALFERHQFDSSLYCITDKIEEADLVLMPYSHNLMLRSAPELLELCAEAAKRAGKPLLIDGIGDIEHEIDIPHAIVLRYGGYRFLKKANEIIIPPYADDLLQIYRAGELEPRLKSKVPSISFAGWAHLSLKQRVRAMIKELPDRAHALIDSRYGAFKKGVFFREKAVKILGKNRLVTPNFLVRASYSGHTDTQQKKPEELRKEFVENILGSDYTLDVRGDANASTRLFEILSLGRIPVIVDTERNFPLSDLLDYKKFSVMVDFRQLKNLPEILATFHSRVSERDFIDMQKAARGAYVSYLRVDSLTKPLLEEIRKRMHTQAQS